MRRRSTSASSGRTLWTGAHAALSQEEANVVEEITGARGLHIYKGRGKQEGFHHMQERTGIRQHWLTLNFYYKRQLLNIIYKFTLYIFVFFFLLRDDADTQLSNMMILINAGLFGDAQ